MSHRFVVRIGNDNIEYDKFEDIPKDFDHVIEFSPEIPPPPHTDAQHHEIDNWANRFDELMEREHASSCKKR